MDGPLVRFFSHYRCGVNGGKCSVNSLVLGVRAAYTTRPMVTRSLGSQSGFELLADAVQQAFRGQHLYVRHPRKDPTNYLLAAGGLEAHLDATVPPPMALLYNNISRWRRT